MLSCPTISIDIFLPDDQKSKTKYLNAAVWTNNVGYYDHFYNMDK